MSIPKEEIEKYTQISQESADKMGVTLEEFQLIHQLQHCQQIGALEVEVTELRTVLTALIEKLSPSTPNQQPQEDWN